MRSLCGRGIHRFGHLARRVRCHRAGLVCKTGLPHGDHQRSAGAEELGGFVDSPTRRVGAVVTDEDRRGRAHQCEQLDAKNFSTGCSSIAFGATPICPCEISKNPTPVMFALPPRFVKWLEEG